MARYVYNNGKLKQVDKNGNIIGNDSLVSSRLKLPQAKSLNTLNYNSNTGTSNNLINPNATINSKKTNNVLDKTGATLGNLGLLLGKGAVSKGEQTLDFLNNMTAKTTSKAFELIGRDDLAQKETDSRRNFIERDLTQELGKATGASQQITKNEQNGSLLTKNNLGGQIVQAVGGQLPTIAVGALTGAGGLNSAMSASKMGTLGKIGTTALLNAPTNTMLASSSYGGALQEAYLNGATEVEATKYAIGSTAVEIASEWITGGIPGTGGKGGIDVFADKGIDKISNKLVQDLVRYGYKMVGEGVEEGIAEIMTPILKNATYTIREKINWQDVLNSAIVGGISAGIIEAPNTVSSISNDIRQNKNNTKLPTVNDLVKQEQKSNTNSNQVNLPTMNDIAKNSINTNEIINQSLPVKKLNFIESARKYNIDTNNDTIRSINKTLSQRNINSSWDDTVFKSNKQNALWKLNSDGTREIIFNPKAETGDLLQNVAVHELYHDLTTSQNGNVIKNEILEFAKTKEGYQEARLDLEKTYSEIYDKNSVEFQQLVDEEVVASILGNKLGDQQFVSQLTMQKPSLARQIYNWVVDKLNTLNKSIGYKSERLFWEDIKSKFENAYREEFNVSQSNNSDTRYMITGLKGVKNGIKADSDNQWALDSYNKAQEMLNKKYTNEEIRKKTNWFQDNQGKWKFEISDHNAILSNNIKKNTNHKLSDILNHSELYEMYPKLKKIKIKFKNISNYNNEQVSGQYVPLTNTIEINNKMLEKNNANLLIKKTLLHEIQHYIQKIEHFDKGYTGNNTGEYFENIGEIEASNTANRVTLNEIERMINAPETSKEIPIHPTIQKILENPNSKQSQRLLENPNIANLVNKIYNELGENNEKNNISNKENNKEHNLVSKKTQSINDRIGRKREIKYEIAEGNNLDDLESLEDETRNDSGIRQFRQRRRELDNDIRNDRQIDTNQTKNENQVVKETAKSNSRRNSPDIDEVYNEINKKGDIETQKSTKKGIFYNDGRWGNDINSRQKSIQIEEGLDNSSFSINENSNWQEHLNKNYQSTGKGHKLQDVKLPLPKDPTRAESYEEPEKLANILEERPVTQQEKDNRLKRFFSTKVLDKGYYVDKLARKTKNKELSSKYDYMLMANGVAQQIIGNERFNPKTQKTLGKGLYKIFEPIENSGKLKDFSEYIYHKHNISRMNLSTLFQEDNKPIFGDSVNSETSQSIVEKYENSNPEFVEWAQEIYDYNNFLLDVLVDYGVISSEDKAYYNKKYPYYVPTIRATDKTKTQMEFLGKKASVNTPIKKAKGGNQDIIPLKEAMALRTMQTMNSALRNNFGNELLNTIETQAESNKVNIDDIVGDDIDVDDFITKSTNKNPATLTIFKNGQKITFDIADEIYDALIPNQIIKSNVLNTISKIRRALITEYNPAFMLTNPVKDVQDGSLNSKHPTLFVKNLAEATKQITTKGDFYKLYLANGGSYETYFNYGEGYNKLPIKRSAVDPRKILDKISEVNQSIEMTPRLAEFISSLEAGDSIETAMYNAQEITTNFKRGGIITKTADANGMTFLNASVQGTVKQIRNIQEAKSQGIKGMTNLAVKWSIVGLTPYILSQLIWGDDEEYEELSDYVKNNYYILWKNDDGEFIRIPKGRVVSVIQNLFKQPLDALKGEKIDINEFVDLLQNQVLPSNPTESNIISPLLDAAQNKTWYGGDLVPQRLQSLPAEEQYDESTDSISIWLGKKIGISPIKINYILDQYSGAIGDMILPSLTLEAENDSNSFISNLLSPVKSKFTTDSIMNNQNISDLYDLDDELTKKSKSSNATTEDILKSKYINSIQIEMNKLTAEKRNIQNDKTLTNNEKYKQVKEIQKQINKLAKEGLKNYEKLENYGNYAKVGDKEYYKNSSGEWQKLDTTTAKYKTVKQITTYDKYLTYQDKIDTIKDNYDNVNQRKSAVINYVNSLDLSIPQKAMLIKMNYSSFDSYNKQIIEYINGQDLSKIEKSEILTKIGFTIKDGRVYH